MPNGEVQNTHDDPQISAASCRDLGGSYLCEKLRAQGYCTKYRDDMARHCAKSCDICYAFQPSSCGTQKVCTESLTTRHFDRAYEKGQSQNRCSAVASLLRKEACDEGLEDESRVRDRGYFVVRNFVPPEELTLLKKFVYDLPPATRLLCGASDVQPWDCMMIYEEFQQKFPITGKKMLDLMQRWMDSGFNEVADLGFPLQPTGLEFVKINKWEFTHNASCVLSDVVTAARKYVDRVCINSCPKAERNGKSSDANCWAKCTFQAIVSRMPDRAIRNVLNRAKRKRAKCKLPYPLLDGPIEYVMGGNNWFNFDEYGSSRLWSNLKAHLTKVSHTSIYQGWHDWHTDGPAQYGRFHKIFLMVDKENDGMDANEARRTTNVKLIPAESLYTHSQCFEAFSQDEDTLRRSIFAKNWQSGKTDWENTRQHWGLNHRWNGFEELSCEIPLNPGDMLFFREDVFHRTQDMELNRLSMIMDVLRFPLDDESLNSSQPPQTRPPQPNVLKMLERVDSLEIRRALKSFNKSKNCAHNEDTTSLPQRGYVIVRGAISKSSIEQGTAAFAAHPVVTKIESEGRVYRDLEDVQVEIPGIHSELNTILDTFDKKNLLPHIVGGGSGNGGGRPYQIGGANFVSIDAEKSRTSVCPHCKDEQCFSRECWNIGDWHVDGVGYRGQSIHKFWVVLSKNDSTATMQREFVRSHSNIVAVPHGAIEDFAEKVSAKLHNDTIIRNLNRGDESMHTRYDILEALGCSLELDVGDAVFFFADVFHRTQDMLVDRTALLVNVA